MVHWIHERYSKRHVRHEPSIILIGLLKGVAIDLVLFLCQLAAQKRLQSWHGAMEEDDAEAYTVILKRKKDQRFGIGLNKDGVVTSIEDGGALAAYLDKLQDDQSEV